MSVRRVRFYFAYNSPYGFLASTRVESVLAPLSVEIQRRPVYQKSTTGAPPAPDPGRIHYLLEDVGRFAEAYGLKLDPGPFADTRMACLGFFYARDEGCEDAYHQAVYRARFLEGGDIGSEDTLASLAEGAGLHPRAFLAAIREERFAAALEESNRSAEADGVFGFPFFVYEGQRFWGNDRIEWLASAIAAGGPDPRGESS